MPCTVGAAFTLVFVDDEERLELVDDEREVGETFEMVDESDGEGVDDNDEEGSNVDEMLLLIKVSVDVVVALLISVALMAVCASTIVIRHARNSIKSCFDRLIIQGKGKTLYYFKYK